MKIYKSYEPLSKDDIQEIERVLDVKLPEEYANFLLNDHAYIIHTGFFKVEEREFCFTNFLPYIREENVTHLVDFNLQLRQGLEDYIIFARGHSHDAYLIKISGDDCGCIYYLRLDHTLEEGRLLMAGSFNEFCELLNRFEGYESQFV